MTARRMLCAMICCLLGLSGLPWPLAASTSEITIEEMIVYGRAEQQLGSALSASEGLVGYQDFEIPPLMRVGELVESVPGMVATQHSGTGKANQYFLRGFNLDHGTDFAASVDGTPVNMRTHGHGQGYLDLNFLIPELVKTARYRKGPYHAAQGDFSSAGSVEFSLYDRLPESLVSATIGGYGYGRAMLAGSTDLGAGALLAAVDATVYEGPWDLDENLRQYKGYLSGTFELWGGTARTTFQGYEGEWDATDQIPQRAVESGVIDEYGYIDPDLGGKTSRYALTADVDFESWHAGVYAIDYELSLYSNFTYFLDDPVEGDEFEQRDDRVVWGAWVEGERPVTVGGRAVTLRWGGDARYDDIRRVALYGTDARSRTDVTRRDQVDEISLAAYGEAAVPVTDRLRATVGLRGDYYDWDVTANLSENSGSGSDQLISPKLNLAYLFSDALEAYAGWGRGFHSNDVRGATISVDPGTGEPVEPVDVLVPSEGAELGLRFESGSTFNATLAAFWLELDSELVYVGDAGTVEPNGATRRTGIELTGFWQAADWLSLNAAYTSTDARFKQDQGGGDRIPGAVKETFVVGANAVWENGFGAGLRLRYLGTAPLIEDNSVRSGDSLLLNASASYRWQSLEFRLDAFNLLDSDDDDISYYYASRLEGEPAEGVEDVHFHPLEPRSIRASVTLHWD
ncbi:MAG: TonB-dependent receptor [Pseudomonadales bacterium]